MTTANQETASLPSLLIYNLVPEELQCYVLPAEEVAKHYRLLTTLHGAVGNSTKSTEKQEEAICMLDDLTCSMPAHARKSTPQELVGSWRKYKVEGVPTPQPFASVFIATYLL